MSRIGAGSRARRLQLRIEARELRAVGKLTMEQQPCGLLEARMLRQIVDRIAAVAQLARLAIDERARRAIEINALEPAVNLDRCVVSVIDPLVSARRVFSRGEKRWI